MHNWVYSCCRYLRFLNEDGHVQILGQAVDCVSATLCSGPQPSFISTNVNFSTPSHYMAKMNVNWKMEMWLYALNGESLVPWANLKMSLSVMEYLNIGNRLKGQSKIYLAVLVSYNSHAFNQLPKWACVIMKFREWPVRVIQLARICRNCLTTTYT